MNGEPGLALFETALGLCGVAWNARGLTGVTLPTDPAAARRRLLSRNPQAGDIDPPLVVARAIDRISALMATGEGDLSDIPLDDADLATLPAAVYRVTLAIPPGRTLTYGEVAARIGQPRAAREVGQALGHNPWPIVVPCHRVLGADGKLVGFSAPGGVETKLKMLNLERARTNDAPTLFDNLPLSVKR